ncbi:MAG TPA: nuclear transport factor 2 family protein [Acidimicrobiales bacterium]|nr:nuclear transport factor 2 family protein [Acidimicrobiales bacterium]
MDWQAWARRFEDVDDLDSWLALFAEERTFRDPVTPWTSDIAAVAELTRSIFPDWEQRVDSIRGGDRWAVFEWTGRGTYKGPGAEGTAGVAVVMEGATIVEVDASGQVTRWRDYLDTNESIQQIQAGQESRPS